MTPVDFNLRHLRILAAVVRLGSFSAAARFVGVTQPAVTQAIGRLEALVGAQLVDRSGSTSVPLDAGILLAARADAAAAAVADAFRPHRRGGIGGRAGADADITMAQVRALLALADHGSYAAGAGILGLSQPSLHRSVAELERVAGVALAERRGRGVGLTAAGEGLARAFRLALAELQAALDELAVLGGRDQGRIRVAAHSAALVRLLPAAIARFLAEHPPVVIDVDSAESGAERLASGQIDALLTIDDPTLRSESLAREALVEEPLVIVARAGHPLAGGTMPGLVRLAQAGWAFPPDGGLERAAAEKLFLDGGLYPPAPSVTCFSPSAIVELVARSDLLAVVTQSLAEASGDRLVRIGNPLAGPRRLVLVTRAGWAPTPAQATFLEEVRAAAGRVLAF